MTLSDLLEKGFFDVYIKTGTTIILPTSRVILFLTPFLDLICRKYLDALRRSTWGRRLVYTERWYADYFLLIIRHLIFEFRRRGVNNSSPRYLEA